MLTPGGVDDSPGIFRRANPYIVLFSHLPSAYRGWSGAYYSMMCARYAKIDAKSHTISSPMTLLAMINPLQADNVEGNYVERKWRIKCKSMNLIISVLNMYKFTIKSSAIALSPVFSLSSPFLLTYSHTPTHHTHMHHRKRAPHVLRAPRTRTATRS